MNIINFDDFSERHEEDRGDDWRMPKFNSRWLIIARTGQGKTNLLMNILLQWIIFDTLIVIAKDLQEDKYQVLKEWCRMMAEFRADYNEFATRQNKNRRTKTKIPLLNPFRYFFSENINDTPHLSLWGEEPKPGVEPKTPEDFLGDDGESLLLPDWRTRRTVMIFDDCITEKDQSKVEEIFTMGRKRNIATFYLTQVFFMVPKVVRRNVSTTVLFRGSDKTDIKRITKAISSRIPEQKFLELYHEATTPERGFLFVDEGASSIPMAYRAGFDGFYTPSE